MEHALELRGWAWWPAAALLLANIALIVRLCYVRGVTPLGLYLFWVHTPYLVWFLLGWDWAVGWRAWIVAAGHISVAVAIGWDAIPGTRERRAIITWLLVPWTIAAVVVFLMIPPGYITNYRAEYYLLNGSGLAAVIQGLAVAGWAAWRTTWYRQQWEALFIGLWFVPGTVANGISRFIWDGRGEEATRAAWRSLSAMESTAHLILLIAFLCLTGPLAIPTAADRAGEPSSPECRGAASESHAASQNPGRRFVRCVIRRFLGVLPPRSTSE